MRESYRLLLLLGFLTLFLLPLAKTTSFSVSNAAPIMPSSESIISGYQDEASWWNSTFIYRRYFNFTEPNVSDRTNLPIHLYLTFEDEHCYRDSIRVMEFENPGWSAKEFQVWNVSYWPGGTFIKSARVSFMINMDRGATLDDVYIYYAKEEVGSVSYPTFYPFIYKSYTFSLINLVSYYDSNNYYLTMFDDPLYGGDGTWKDPNNVNDGVDTRWKNLQVTPDSTPYGTLDKFENVRYEPTASDYNDFFGYYTVYSNYPLAVSMGQGDKGSNGAINDWFPGVDENGNGLGYRFILGGVEGFESRNEGKYWIQAHYDDTNVYVWTAGDTLDTGWTFFNGTSVTAWPAVLKAGEYISKRDVVYTTYVIANSTKPVSVRLGDSDSSYARDIGGFYPSVTGSLVGEEFYTIDMGNSYDRTRVTNIGDSPVTVEWWRNTGSGWVKGANLTDIPVNGSATISHGTSSSSDQEDILRILAPAGSRIFVEGIYNPPTVSDFGDWNPTMTGDRFGVDYRVWGGRTQKIFVLAWENAKIDISSYSGTYSLELAAGDAGFYMPVSSSQSLHDLHSNATISVVVCGEFSTSSPYYPSGDQGYGWMVPSYSPEGDQVGVIISASDEIKLFEFDVTVVDLDGLPVAGAYVELFNTDNNPWLDDNGLGRSGVANANGLVIFEGLSNQTFRIQTEIDAATWLSTSYSNIWVKDTTDHDVDGSVTFIQVTLDMADVDIHLDDLMGNSMNDNDNEDTNLRLNNQTGDTSEYIAQGQTDASGWVHFNRVPQDDYNVYARYAGSLGWSYSYDDLTNFASWAIDASEFNGGSFSHDWDLPLITLDLHVVSWDQLDVVGATIKINNSVDMNAYQITKTSDASGEYSFYRIVNGTWNLDMWKADDYASTPLARNFTVSLTDLQAYTSETIQLPLSRLIIRVQTSGAANVEGAQVNVTLRGGGLVAQGTTNSTGHVTFMSIHANLTGPYQISYNVTVVKGLEENGTLTELLVKCDHDWWYVNRIIIGEPQYNALYTELNATTYFINTKWGKNTTFSVGWFDRTGQSTSPITFDSTSWLNFTIYYGSTPVGWGTWNQSASTWIGDPVGIYFLVTIDTDFWNLGVSPTAYQIRIEADTSLKNAPTPITIYLTVQAASTAQGIGTSHITEYYGTQSEHLYWLRDTTNGVNVSALDVHTYTLKLGTQTLKSGVLLDNGNGTYRLPVEVLNGIDVGNYLIYISLQKVNYVNQSFVVDVTLANLPMNVSISPNVGYEWSLSSDSIIFQYQIAWNTTATDLSNVHVTIEWLTYPAGVSFLNVTKTLSATGGDLTYSFMRNAVPVGNWTVRITCFHDNYDLGTGVYSAVEVTAATTTLTPLSPSDQTVDWTEHAVFEFDYFRSATGLAGASVVTDYVGTVIVNYLGNGRYSITFDTAIPADAYVISIGFSLANHQSRSDSVSVTIRVPISIETDFGSEETPLIAYWTRTFDIVVRLMDLSRTDTNISGAAIDYDWDFPVYIDSGTLAEVPGHPGLYGVTLVGSQASPLIDEYQITLTATSGPSTASATIFLVIQDVPNEIVLEQKLFRAYYGDTVTVRFYWLNTLDNEPIVLPSSVVFEIVPLGVGISGVTNYGNGTYSFVVDTGYLGMSVDDFDGFYPVSITLLADGFATGTEEVYFLMSESPSEMELVGAAEAIWSDDLTIKVNLQDTLHGFLIWEEATVEFVYGTDLVPLNSFGNGTFWTTFDSSAYFTASATPYHAIVRYSLPNYVDGELDIDVLVTPIAGELKMSITSDVPTGTYNGSWSDIVEVEFSAVYVSDGTALPEGVATYYWVGFETIGGTFIYDTFRYTLDIDTSEVPAGLRTLRLVVTLANHSVMPYDVVVNLSPLIAVFERADSTPLEAIYGSTQLIDVAFDLTYLGSPLLGDGITVTLYWAGRQFPHRIVGDQYVISFSASQVTGLNAPETYSLTFVMDTENYTAPDVVLNLKLLAPAELSLDSVSIELGQTLTVYFMYYDTLNNVPIQATSISAIVHNVPLTVVFNGTHYSMVITAAEIGVVGDRFDILFTIVAEDYADSDSSPVPFTIELSILEPTYNFGPLGRYPRSTVNTMLLMTGLFAIAVGIAVGVRRMRIPYQVKQIDKALSHIEKGKTAKVEKIKTMGMVISELLAPGLAELDIEAPVIEAGPEDVGEAIFDEDANELLGELDALGDLGIEAAEAPGIDDFEAQLEAELEAIEVPEAEKKPQTTEAEESEPAPETEPKVVEESPEETTEVGDETEPRVDEVSEAEPEPEPEGADVAKEPSEVIPDETEAVLPAVEESLEKLSKKELIDRLPPEIRERYPDEELRKLRKAELIELLDYMDTLDEE